MKILQVCGGPSWGGIEMRPNKPPLKAGKQALGFSSEKFLENLIKEYQDVIDRKTL